MRHGFRICSLALPDFQMMADRPLVSPQLPSRSADSFEPDGGFKIPKRNCSKLGPAGVRPGLDSIFLQCPGDHVLRAAKLASYLSD